MFRRKPDGVRSRSRRIGLIAAAALVVAIVIASLPLFVFPASSKPRRADAIVVLGGAGNRLGIGLGLARQGFAPTLVISSGGECTWKPPDGVRVICFRPKPFTTQG